MYIQTNFQYKYADLAESDVIELFSQFKDLRLSSGSPGKYV